MTAVPPDPDPADTPGLEPGGGVAPGSTPPDSAQTSGLSEPQATPRRRLTPSAIVGISVVVVFVLLFVTVAVAMIVSMV